MKRIPHKIPHGIKLAPFNLNPENKFSNFDNGFLTIFYNKIVDWAHNKKCIVVPLDHYLVLTIKG